MAQEDRVDLSQLGFEIRVPTSSNNSCSQEDNNASLECECDYDKAPEAAPAPAPAGPMRLQDEDGEYDIVPDDVSGVSYYTSDDDSSYSEDFTDDEEDDNDHRGGYRPRGKINRKPMPTRTFPKRTLSGRRQRSNDGLTNADLGYEDLGYEATPSRSQLGYGEDDEEEGATNSHPSLGCGYGVDNETASVSSIRMLSVGKPVNNRRSIGMARRLTGNSARPRRRSSISASTGTSSFGSAGKMRHAHGKSRKTQREKMVARTTSRRMSRQHPSQLKVNTDHQTLQDLGCSELFLDPRRVRMPKRVSLEYGPGDGNDSITAPKCISLEFDQNSQHGSRVPRKVSISFDQRSSTNNIDCSRRGSLDFSVGTSQLPRRGSMGRSSHNSLSSSTHRRGSRSPPPPCGTCGRPKRRETMDMGSASRQQNNHQRSSTTSVQSSTLRSNAVRSTLQNCRRRTMDLGGSAHRNLSPQRPQPPSARNSYSNTSKMTLSLSPPQFQRAASCGTRPIQRFAMMTPQEQSQSFPPAAGRRVSMGHKSSAAESASSTSKSKLPTLSPPQFNRAASCGTRPTPATMTPQSFPPGIIERRVTMGHKRSATRGSKSPTRFPRRTSSIGDLPSPRPTMSPPPFRRAISCGEGTPTPARRSKSPLRDNSSGTLDSSRRRVAPIPRKQFRSSTSSVVTAGSLHQSQQQPTIVNHDDDVDDDLNNHSAHHSCAPEETRDAAHTTTKQQSIGLQQLSLSSSHVGAVQYLTRDTHTPGVAILGRSA